MTYGVKTITITHPFHPDKDKVYEYLGLMKFEHGDYVRCLDGQGEYRLIPMPFTDLHTTFTDVTDAGCVMTVDDLLALSGVIDDILRSHKL